MSHCTGSEARFCRTVQCQTYGIVWKRRCYMHNVNIQISLHIRKNQVFIFHSKIVWDLPLWYANTEDFDETTWMRLLNGVFCSACASRLVFIHRTYHHTYLGLKRSFTIHLRDTESGSDIYMYSYIIICLTALPFHSFNQG